MYSLYFHPLRKYPGPRHLAASRLPITNASLRGTYVPWLQALHEHYGPVVRIAPNELSYTDDRAWGDITNPNPAARWGMNRHQNFEDLFGGELINPDPTMPRAEQKHGMMRRAFLPSLTKRALAAQEPLITGHVNDMIRQVAGNLTESHNALALYACVSFNIFSDLFLGESLNLFNETRFFAWIHTIPFFLKSTAFTIALNRFTLTRNIIKIPAYFFGTKLRDKFLNFAYERIDRRLAMDTDRPDMLHFALGAKDDEKRKLTRAEIREISPFLMFASTESTPTTICGLTYLLIKHPKALDKLTREIRSAFKSDRDITLNGTATLEYLHACIEETLRLYPPAAAGVARVVPSAGASIVGGWVPGGTIVHQSHGAIFKASQNFRRPDAFIPERWLPGQDEFSTDKKNSFHPFGAGPQMCIGVE